MPQFQMNPTTANPVFPLLTLMIWLVVSVGMGRAQDQCRLQWITQSPTTSPSARSDLAMAYDSVRNVTVLFGGFAGGAALGDTWEYDGTNWKGIFPTTSPPARLGSAMTYDTARHVSVLFGGRSVTTEYNDVWEWDGSHWTQASVGGTSPATRDRHGMTYDNVRGVHVMFGGRVATQSDYTENGETWEYNGATRSWSLRASSGPMARSSMGLAFDNARNNTVLFGGYNKSISIESNRFLGDTWTWNGASGTWIQQSPAGAPTPRTAGNLAFDKLRGVAVMQNGTAYYRPGTPIITRESWEWNGTTWTDKTFDYLYCCPRQNPGMVFESRRYQMLMFGGDGAFPAGTWTLAVPLNGLPVRYVDKANTGTQDGSQQFPFNTVQQALNCTDPGATILIKAGDYAEGPKSMFKPVSLKATNGFVQIH